MNRARLLKYVMILRDRLRGLGQALQALRKRPAAQRAEAERLDRLRNPSKYRGR
jgi:hypothetical protein